MADQAAAKKLLQELSKQNKVCNDCSNPNPQWASISFAVLLCLQCAGTHRGFGVHISFVRSVSMDTWQDDQIKRMQLGGNIPFKEFMQSYPAEQGGYTEGMTPYDTYHCWAATQYREKLDAMLADRPWSPSAPPEGTSTPGSVTASPGRPSSAQGLRKSRASTRAATGSSLRSSSASPASFRNSPQTTPDLSADKKAGNESYFASLGELNASRPAELPPSQGGRYSGFGNTPSPPAPSHPSYKMSSAATPSLSELQQNPMAALGKGWSLFSAAVVGASRVVSENVIQPGVEKVTDPNLQASVKGYVSEAQKRAAMVGSSANQWSKNQFGVDVAESVGGVMDTVKDKIGGGPTRSGYDSLSQDHEETTSLYHDGDDDLFTEYSHSGGLDHAQQQYDPHDNSASTTTKKDDWDEWKDF